MGHALLQRRAAENTLEKTCTGYRLPTEASGSTQLERGVTRVCRVVEGNEVAWFDTNANGTTHPVGLKNPMLGDFTICQGMSGSGSGIGMTITPETVSWWIMKVTAKYPIG